jgi:hypothetical protein
LRCAFGCLALVLGGCAYTSEYVAPPDGRARAVWLNDHVVVQPSGAPIADSCVALLGWVSPSNQLHLLEGDMQIEQVQPLEHRLEVRVGFWIPRYWGPPLGRTPLGLPHPPLFLPPRLLPPDLSLVAAKQLGGRGGWAPGRVRVSGANAAHMVDAPCLLAVLAAITLVVLPAVTVGLASSRPEDSEKNAEAIDQVNLFNDLARTPGSPCAPDEGAW